jgi:flagellar secretion chaperone FliS
MNRGGYKQYSQVQIQTANKGKLIVMLYQGAIRFMKKAQLLIDKNDMEGKGNCLIRAQDIILELLYALDQEMLEKGDDLALNLQRLYLYAYRRLVQANIHIDVKAIDEVIALMANLLEAWERIIGGAAQGEVGGQTSPGVALTG